MMDYEVGWLLIIIGVLLISIVISYVIIKVFSLLFFIFILGCVIAGIGGIINIVVK